MIELVGVLGLTLIVLGWLFSIREVPPPTLSGLYSLGSIMLAVYAYSIGNWIFLLLNLGAAVVSSLQFVRGCKRAGRSGAAGGI